MPRVFPAVVSAPRADTTAAGAAASLTTPPSPGMSGPSSVGGLVMTGCTSLAGSRTA